MRKEFVAAVALLDGFLMAMIFCGDNDMVLDELVHAPELEVGPVAIPEAVSKAISLQPRGLCLRCSDSNADQALSCCSLHPMIFISSH